jgi:hypothetical protein
MAIRSSVDQGACQNTTEVDCLSGVVLYVASIPVLAAVTWVLLAFAVGAWRAPTITVAGGWLSVYGLTLYSKLASNGADAPTWAAAAIGGLGFAAVALACIPGLRRTSRIAVVVGLSAVFASAWVVLP